MPESPCPNHYHTLPLLGSLLSKRIDSLTPSLFLRHGDNRLPQEQRLCFGSSLSSSDATHDTAGAVMVVTDVNDNLCDALIPEKQIITASRYGAQSQWLVEALPIPIIFECMSF